MEPSYDTLKWLSVYRAYPIDMPISSARLPTAEVGSTGARALVLVHSRLQFHMVRLSVSESSVDPSYDQFKLLPGLPESSSIPGSTDRLRLRACRRTGVEE